MRDPMTKVHERGQEPVDEYHAVLRTSANRRPQTGDPLEIPAGYGVKVSAGSKLKEAAKGK